MRTMLVFLASLFWCFELQSAESIGASLIGSAASLQKQNKQADNEKLTRIVDDPMLERFKKSAFLVHLPEFEGLKIDARLDEKWRWCRPWVEKFLVDTAYLHFTAFNAPLQINSAVRTIKRQAEISVSNQNASKESVHPTGSVIDIAKLNLTRNQIAWMRQYLLLLEKLGYIEATEEHWQHVFHVMVFKHYP